MINEVNLRVRIEALVCEKQNMQISQIYKEFEITDPEDRVKVSSILSQLILEKTWTTQHIKGRLFVSSQSAVSKQNQITTVKHRDSGTSEVIPKAVPHDEDWVVSCVEGCSDVLFFDKKYSLDEIRSAYRKLHPHVKFADTRGRRYHKKLILIEARYNNF